MKLVESAIKSFHVAKLFKENTDQINHIDYSPAGDLLVSSSDDDQIVIYNCESGTVKRSLNSKKYGVDLIRFTHTKTSAVYSSTKIDDTIRYLSLHDNKFIRYFPGHTKKVGSLSMSPVDDTFISGSHDKTLRLWDLKSPNCQGLMHVGARPVAAYDPQGLIFAAAMNSEEVKLYDIRSFDKGPFNTFRLNQDKDCDWTGLKFSPDGRSILITTNGSLIRLIDAFNGNLLRTFHGYANNKGLSLEASFSPDSQFVFSGSTDGKIHMWNVDTDCKVGVLTSDHIGNSVINCVQFNPKMMMLASTCINMSFWIPSMDD